MEEEKKLSFRKKDAPDLTQKVLAVSYAKFALPEADEGFDDIQYVWQPEAECKEYMKKWVSERKLTQRVEELQPSDWFKGKWTEWQKLLSSWKKKQQEFKDPALRKKAEALKKKQKEEAKKKKAE